MNLEDFRWPSDPERIPTEYAWGRIRIWRDAELRSTDFTQLPDVLNDKNAWAAYRQALRDITEFESPEDIIWPVRPDDIKVEAPQVIPAGGSAVEEVPVEEPVVGESPAEEVITEEPIAEELPVVEEAQVVEEALVAEVVAEEPPVAEPVAEEIPAYEPVIDEAIAEEPVIEELPSEEPPAEDPPAEETVIEEEQTDGNSIDT